MSFQTGTATDLDDLIDKLRLFALANGWTVNKYVAPVGGFDSELYLQKNSVYAIIDARVSLAPEVYHGISQNIDRPFINLYMATGFNGGSAASAQPGTSLTINTDWLLGPMTAYYFFTDATKDYIHVVVQTIPGEFQHFGFGEVEKIGTYTGGWYGYGTVWNQSAINIDVPFDADHVLPFDGSSNVNNGDTKLGSDVDGVFSWKRYYVNAPADDVCVPVGRNGIYDDLTNTIGVNTFNGLTPLVPMIAAHRLAGTRSAIIGHYPDIRRCSVEAIAPATTQSIGGDTYWVFPMQTKKNPSVQDDLPNSGYLGFAYKVIP